MRRGRAGRSGVSGGASPSGDAALTVVATTTVFADIVRQVGGDRVSVSSIIPPGAGPEDYEPKPLDARKLAGADLIVSNGLGLDDFLDKLIEAAGEGSANRLVLGDGVPTITVDGEENPHLWLDPSIVADHYLPAITAELSRLDPAGASSYEANRGRHTRRRSRRWTRRTRPRWPRSPWRTASSSPSTTPFPTSRRHYGFEVVGVILPNVGQEPTASDLAALVERVKAAHVPAVFSEAQFSPELANTLAHEAGITKVVTTLYNDTVGPPPNDTYLSMMSWNMDQIVEALG